MEPEPPASHDCVCFQKQQKRASVFDFRLLGDAERVKPRGEASLTASSTMKVLFQSAFHNNILDIRGILNRIAESVNPIFSLKQLEKEVLLKRNPNDFIKETPLS